MMNYTTISVNKNTYQEISLAAKSSGISIVELLKNMLAEYKQKRSQSLEAIMQPIWDEAKKLKPLDNIDTVNLDWSTFTDY